MGLFSKKYPYKNFTPILEKARLGDFILYHNMKPDVIGDGIEWFTSGIGDGRKASHVDMYIGNKKVIGYTIGGCKKMQIDRYFKNHMKIYVLRIKGITPFMQTGMYNEARKDLNDWRPYDYVSYAGFMFMAMLYKCGYKGAFKHDNPLQGAGKVCSSGGGKWAIRGANIDLFPNIGDESETPHHYFESQALETIIGI